MTKLYDPNIADLSAVINSAPKGAVVVLNVTHLKPTKVLKDTTAKFKAIYTDNHGAYEFDLRKNGAGYKVTVDGQPLYSAISKERVEYEFECQINSNKIKCLA
jgi:hypothetical protein